MARITANQGLPMFQMARPNADFSIDPFKASQQGGLLALQQARDLIEKSKVPGLLGQVQQGGQIDPTTLARIRSANPQAAQGLIQAAQENRARQTQERNMRQFDFQDEAEKQKFGVALAIQTAQKMQSVGDASSKRAIMEVAKRTAQRAGLDISDLPQDVEQFEQYVSKFQQKHDERQQRQKSSALGSSADERLIARLMQEEGLTYNQAFNRVRTGKIPFGREVRDGRVVDKENYVSTEEKIKRGLARGTETGKKEVEDVKRFEQKQRAYPIAEVQKEGTFDQTDYLIESIDDAYAQAQQGEFNTGLIGSLLSNVAGSDAYDLQANTETILANLGFEKLKELKEAGTTLGQIAVAELQALQASIANLATSQSKPQYLKNLERVKKRLVSFKNRYDRAFKAEYKDVIAQEQVPRNRAEVQSANNPLLGVPTDVMRGGGEMSEAEIMQQYGL